MDDKDQLDKVIDFYKSREMTGLAAIIEKREYVRNEFKSQFSRFVENLKKRDSNGVKDALERINGVFTGENRLLYIETEEEKAIAGYSDFVAVVDHIKKGGKEVNFSRLWLNPFLGTPDEMLELCVLNSGGYYHPITSLLFGVEEFLGRTVEEKQPLSDAVCYYIEPWVKRMIDLVYEDIDSVFSDTGDKYDRNDDPDGPALLGSFLSCLIYDSRLERVSRYAFEVFNDYLCLIENNVDAAYSPLNTAIECGNEWAFDKLISVDGITKDRIQSYPEKNESILDKLFNLGALLPGTDKGRIAFNKVLSNGRSHSENTIKRIIHPSYFKKTGIYGTTPIVRAIRNGVVNPDTLYLLINSEEDINGQDKDVLSMPPLGYAIEEGNLVAIKELFRLGADINWHDRWGNNIFHYIFSRSRCQSDTLLTHETEDIFENSLTEENVFGRTPYDYNAEADRSLLDSYERISVNTVIDKVFSDGVGRNASSLFVADIRIGGDVFKRLFDDFHIYLKENEGSVKSVEITTIDQLDEEYKRLSSTNEKTAVFIPNLLLIYEDNEERVEEMLDVMCSNESIAVFAVVRSAVGLVSRLLDKGIRNLFVGNIDSALYSDILFGQHGAEVLADYEVIFKQNNELSLLDFKAEVT